MYSPIKRLARINIEKKLNTAPLRHLDIQFNLLHILHQSGECLSVCFIVSNDKY